MKTAVSKRNLALRQQFSEKSSIKTAILREAGIKTAIFERTLAKFRKIELFLKKNGSEGGRRPSERAKASHRARTSHREKASSKIY